MADSISSPDPVPPVLSEIQAGEGLSLSAAGRLFPAHRGEGSIDPSTVFRWVTTGSRATDGRLVKLEGVRVGSRWLTSRAAVARFVAALTAAAAPEAPEPAQPAARTPKSRQKSCDRAIDELKRRGA